MQVSALLLTGIFVVMIASNQLSRKKVFGGKEIKDVSQANPTYLTPDGKTFAIWGLIYLMELVMIIAQLIPSDTTEEIFARKCPITGLDVRERLMLAFGIVAVWLPLFINEFFLTALVVIAAYLGFLISAYTDLAPRTLSSVEQVVLFSVGVSLNTSWALVATLVSFFQYVGTLGWKTDAVAGNVPVACGGVVFVGYLGCVQAFLEHDFAWAFVAAWACMGIKRMQTIPEQARFPVKAMNSTLASIATYTAYVVMAVMAASVATLVVA
mmetsp:Transcript_107905/g.247362  ORF Transcript_107905/g.247362 Transcript_107905/m.247362 type:complete len:268 (+) Transcript_107905:45-848(+)